METINVSFLTDSERALILEVLQRDEELRRLDERRVKRLKAELLDIRRKGAKRVNENYSNHSCGRCQKPLGHLITGANQCPACKHQVCLNCRSAQFKGSWLCNVCAKETDLKKSTGDWFYAHGSNRFCGTPGHDVVWLSLRKMLTNFMPTSVIDVHCDGTEFTNPPMGDRSKSVLALNIDDDEEEEEDIDFLVNIHRKTLGDSSTNLCGSQSTLGSMMSVHSEADYDTVDVSGDIIFVLHYNERAQSLSIIIKECRELAYADAAKKKCNPYVKSYLLPDSFHKSKKKTSTKRNTINPNYNETLKYTISRPQLMSCTLQLSVWHHGNFGHSTFLGEVNVSLDCHDIDTAYEACVALRGKAANSLGLSPFAQYKGELVISLKYVAEKRILLEKMRGKKAKTEYGGELHVLIKEAKNLFAMKAGGTSDSFVKGYLLPSFGKSTKRKTKVVKNTVNPHYDHTFVYKELSLEQLKGMCLELTVWDRVAMSSNHFVGCVCLSSGAVRLMEGNQEWVADSTGEEASLWQKMIQFPDSWAEGTLRLRSSLGKGK